MKGQIIDSHQHFWQIGRFDYAWMSREDTTLYQDYLPDRLAPVLQANGVARTVAVQAHQSLAETRWLLRLAADHDFIAGVVGWVDLAGEAVAAQLDELAAHPKFVGVRHLAQDEPADDWLVKPEVLRGLRVLAKYRLAYDLLVFTRHLRYIPALAEHCPDLRLVVDHLAKPHVANGDIKEWARGLKAVAAYPQIYCKLSGLVTEADHKAWRVEDLRPYVETALELFGPERIMFGSDYPVCRRAATYAQVLEAAQTLLSGLDDAQHQRVFRDNAAQFYRL